MRIYLDYASSTPVHPEVELAMRPYFSLAFGNPGSLHSFGQEAIAALDRGRETIAAALGVDFREIIFTGSATEANNLALRGAIKVFKANYPSVIPKIIVSSIEHESILETVEDLKTEGVEVVYLSVQEGGLVDLKKLESFLDERTILVSIMYANNEIGTIEPIAEISKIISDFKASQISLAGAAMRPSGHGLPAERGGAQGASPARPLAGRPSGSREGKFGWLYPLFHTDASQAFQFLDCNVKKLGVDLMTISAHKIYGPKGVGALYIRNLSPKTYHLKPIITGGGQEFSLRSGTENVLLVVGFAKAVELIQKNKEREAKRLRELSEYFLEGLKKIYPGVELNGPKEKGERLPNILNIYFPDYEAEDLTIKFDLRGLAVSTGSACRSRSAEPSYVLKALGFTGDRIKKSLRISFGRPTTKSEIDNGLGIIKIILK
ncbi:MAG: cysteine desulfurase [Candidatus Liptonbacteria bacterium]|nr:cysteine desulfurase [Candidatus Liptonbacteria bacterium]